MCERGGEEGGGKGRRRKSQTAISVFPPLPLLPPPAVVRETIQQLSQIFFTKIYRSEQKISGKIASKAFFGNGLFCFLFHFILYYIMVHFLFPYPLLFCQTFSSIRKTLNH